MTKLDRGPQNEELDALSALHRTMLYNGQQLLDALRARHDSADQKHELKRMSTSCQDKWQLPSAAKGLFRHPEKARLSTHPQSIGMLWRHCHTTESHARNILKLWRVPKPPMGESGVGKRLFVLVHSSNLGPDSAPKDCCHCHHGKKRKVKPTLARTWKIRIELGPTSSKPLLV